MDALLLAVIDQVITLEDGVTLNLISSWNDTGAVDECLKLWEWSASVKTLFMA
jgi:hypothetical protein